MSETMKIVKRLAEAWNDRDADSQVIGSVLGELQRELGTSERLAIEAVRNYAHDLMSHAPDHDEGKLGSCPGCTTMMIGGELLRLTKDIDR